MAEANPEKSQKVDKKKKKKTKEVRVIGPTEDRLATFQERMRQEAEEDKKRIKDKMNSKMKEEELKVDKLRLQMRKKCKSMIFEKPVAYEPQEPVKKSSKLIEFEESLAKGTFFDNENTKQILENVRNSNRRIKLMNKLAAYDVDVGFGFGRA